jgi:hypothetical protein
MGVHTVEANNLLGGLTPACLRVRGFRFYFFSREEPRAHVHVQHAEGEAKFGSSPRLNFMRTTASGRSDSPKQRNWLRNTRMKSAALGPSTSPVQELADLKSRVLTNIKVEGPQPFAISLGEHAERADRDS